MIDDTVQRARELAAEPERIAERLDAAADILRILVDEVERLRGIAAMVPESVVDSIAGPRCVSCCAPCPVGDFVCGRHDPGR